MAQAPAHAVVLGKASVQSAIGEPLAAEIELPDLPADGANDMQVQPASAEVYRSMGMNLHPALRNLRIELKTRANKSRYLAIRSDQPIPEPFVEVVVVLRWSSGELKRGYTFLLDPPNTTPSPIKPTVTPSVAPDVPSVPAAATPSPPADTSASRSVEVVRGDTAGRLVSRFKPDGVSMEQALMALLKANPDAFVEGNVNRLKAGAVVRLPTATEAAAIPAEEARGAVMEQTRDFNAFRQRLAGTALEAAGSASSREATGRPQAQSSDANVAPVAQDTLKLSKTPSPEGSAEDDIAKGLAAKEAQARLQEASQNAADLARLQEAVNAASSSGSAAPAPAPTIAPAAPTAAPTAPIAALDTQEVSVDTLVERWSQDPRALPAAAIVLGLLALLGLFRLRSTSKPLGQMSSGGDNKASPPPDRDPQSEPALGTPDSDAHGVKADATDSAQDAVLEAQGVDPQREPVMTDGAAAEWMDKIDLNLPDAGSRQTEDDGVPMPVPVPMPVKTMPDVVDALPISAKPFDLDSLDLELDPRPTSLDTPTTPEPHTPEPEGRLAFAEALLAQGDTEAARSMAMEVLERGDSNAQARAKAFLASLN